MKDNLFEFLFQLFEQSMAQMQQSHNARTEEALEAEEDAETSSTDTATVFVASAKANSTRICTADERIKLTKASYQFLMRLKLWGVIDADGFEEILHHVSCSQSRIVTLDEIKWIVRSILEDNANEKQRAFLDLILYQEEVAPTAH